MHKVAWAALAALLCGQEATQPFRSRNGTFELDLPAGWRQPTPDEVRQLRSVLPPDLHVAEPLLVYFVGPVDRWLQGSFDGRVLQVVESAEEWTLPDDWAAAITARWQQVGAEKKMRHDFSGIRKVKVGKDQHEVIECLRRTEPEGQRAFRTLDVHAPTGGIQLTLAFRSWDGDFDAALPELRRQADSLRFAHKARGQPKLSDRLWTPVVTGLLVGALFLWLYHRNRRRV